MARPSNDDLQRRTQLFSAITGSAGAQVTGDTRDVRGMLQTVYGTTRGGKPAVDTRKAAKSLGVSQRTVQRWLKNTNTPSPDHLKKISTKARQTATTKRGRARAARAAAAQRPDIAQKGTTVKVVGFQGPSGYEFDKQRASFQHLSPDEYQQMVAAYVENGDQGAMQFLQKIYDREYVDDWRFGTVNEISFKPGRSRFDDPRA